MGALAEVTILPTFQVVYDGGVPPVGNGAGRTLDTMNGGAVVFTNSGANNNTVFEVSKTPAGPQSGDGVSVVMGANATGRAHLVDWRGTAGGTAVRVQDSGLAGALVAGLTGIVVDLSSAQHGNQVVQGVTIITPATTAVAATQQGLLNLQGRHSLMRDISVVVRNKGAANTDGLVRVEWDTTNFEGAAAASVLTADTNMLVLDGQTNVDASTNDVTFRGAWIRVPSTASAATRGIIVESLQTAGSTVNATHAATAANAVYGYSYTRTITPTGNFTGGAISITNTPGNAAFNEASPGLLSIVHTSGALATDTTTLFSATATPAAAGSVVTGGSITLGANALGRALIVTHNGTVAGAGSVALRLAGADESVALEMTDGDTVGISAGSEGRLVYNGTDQWFKVSHNGGAYAFVVTAAAAGAISLQLAYNGGAGITLGAGGPVAISKAAVDATAALTLLVTGGTGPALSFPAGGSAITHVQGPSDRPFALASLAPVQVAASVAGNAATFAASNATAGSAVDGAAAGGSVTITAGAAARLNSGNANGGDINLTCGAGIGTGVAGRIACADYILSRPALIDYAEVVVALGNVVDPGGATCNLESGNVFTATATGACTWVFSNPPIAGRCGSITINLQNGGAGAQTWPGTVVWPGGVAPTLSAAGYDALSFFTTDAGVTWYGVGPISRQLAYNGGAGVVVTAANPLTIANAAAVASNLLGLTEANTATNADVGIAWTRNTVPANATTFTGSAITIANTPTLTNSFTEGGALVSVRHAPLTGAGTLTDTTTLVNLLYNPTKNSATDTVTGQLITMTPNTAAPARGQTTIMGANTSAAGYAATFDWRGTAGTAAGNGIMNVEVGAATILTGQLVGHEIDLSTNVTPGANAIIGQRILIPATTRPNFDGHAAISVNSDATRQYVLELDVANTQDTVNYFHYGSATNLVAALTFNYVGMFNNVTANGVTVNMLQHVTPADCGVLSCSFFTDWRGAAGTTNGVIRIQTDAGTTLTAALYGVVVDLSALNATTNDVAVIGVRILTPATDRANTAGEGALAIDSNATAARVVDIDAANTSGNILVATASATAASSAYGYAYSRTVTPAGHFTGGAISIANTPGNAAFNEASPGLISIVHTSGALSTDTTTAFYVSVAPGAAAAVTGGSIVMGANVIGQGFTIAHSGVGAGTYYAQMITTSPASSTALGGLSITTGANSTAGALVLAWQGSTAGVGSSTGSAASFSRSGTLLGAGTENGSVFGFNWTPTISTASPTLAAGSSLLEVRDVPASITGAITYTQSGALLRVTHLPPAVAGGATHTNTATGIIVGMTPASSAAVIGISVVMGANATGAAISVSPARVGIDFASVNDGSAYIRGPTADDFRIDAGLRTTAGTGRALNFTAGAGVDPGAGGPVYINGGAAASTGGGGAQNGGAIDIQPGAGANGGLTGFVRVGPTTACAIEMKEMTAPAAGGADTGRLYLDVSGVKTRLMIIFQSGVAQQIAIEP